MRIGIVVNPAAGQGHRLRSVISRLEDFLYVSTDFYDTNYHLLSKQAKANTALWLEDIREQMVKDGLWEVAE